MCHLKAVHLNSLLEDAVKNYLLDYELADNLHGKNGDSRTQSHYSGSAYLVIKQKQLCKHHGIN